MKHNHYKSTICILTILFSLIFFPGHLSFGKKSAPFRVNHLTCEYKVNPIGMDTYRPRLSWQLQATAGNVMQTAYEIRVAETRENLGKGEKLIWTSGKRMSDRSVLVPYRGPEPVSGQRVFWQVRAWDNQGHRSTWSEPAYWETGLLQPSGWKAKWIASNIKEDITRSNPAQYFRKEFHAKGKILTARAYVTGLGLYEFSLNGKKVGDQLFTPGWTSYEKRLQYQVYDVTQLVKPGGNTAGMILGDGWYRGNIGYKGLRNAYGNKLAMLFQIIVEYDNGAMDTIISDDTWKASTGPILASDIYNGEFYDARLEQDGWNRPGFDDTGWKGVIEIPAPKAKLVAPEGLPVKKMQELNVISVIVTPQGDTVVDMGQNMVGWVRLQAKGLAGTKITLRHAEVLDKDGNFYTLNLRAARQTDTYIMKGGGEETFEPHFTFHGFRYVAVSGYPGKLLPRDLTGIVIYSDFNITGEFECSDSLVNRLQHNIQWGQKGNFLDVPTDCPQRDERLGWTGDAQVFARTACFNAAVAPFYTKWMKDFIADQQDEGQIPFVIPDVLSIKNHHKGSSASAGWADASVIVPWMVYLSYGDQRILENQYGSMKKWVDYMARKAGNTYFWNTDFTFGDWLAFSTTRPDYPGATTDKDFISQVYFARSTRLLMKTATVLGKVKDAEHYRQLFENIKKVFQEEFLTPNGRLSPNTQTAYALALYADLIPDSLVTKTAGRLAEDVRKFKHLTTGFLGTPVLCPVLSDNGYTDLAYMLLKHKEYPSWLYPVTRGATTIWERWDGIKPDGTFQNPGMNSFNHYAYGAIGEWLYRYVAGLETDEKQPGYKHIIFQPHPGGQLSYAKASHQTPYGKAAIFWKMDDGKISISITVPVNTTAKVILPFARMEQITENKQKISEDNYRPIRKGNNVILHLGSGSYQFNYPVSGKSE